ncbi:MAG: hypothetical protein ACRDU4_01195 [Mycobacterium sp.]
METLTRTYHLYMSLLQVLEVNPELELPHTINTQNGYLMMTFGDWDTEEDHRPAALLWCKALGLDPALLDTKPDSPLANSSHEIYGSYDSFIIWGRFPTLNGKCGHCGR